MKKWMLFLTPFVLASTATYAWSLRFSGSAEAAEKDSHSETHFPLNSDQGWFLEESYLLMKPFLGALEIGDVVSAEGVPNDVELKIKVKEPEFKWNSGARIGLGRYLPNHDKWDISFYSTYFYGSSENRFRSHDPLKGISPAYNSSTLVPSNKLKAVWRLNYFVFDLMLGRQFCMTPHIVLHPYVGLRGTTIFTDFHSRGFRTANNPVSFGKVKLEEDFWGIGPRIGTNWNYKFTGNWSFLGNFAGSLLYGHYHVKETSFSVAPVHEEPLAISLKSFDHSDTLRVNLDCSLGMGWERWFKNNTVRIAPTFQFEGTLWFDMNDFFNPLGNFAQNHGDLGLMGFSFNLLVDF